MSYPTQSKNTRGADFPISHRWSKTFCSVFYLLFALVLWHTPREVSAYSETITYYFQNTTSSEVCGGMSTPNQTSIVDVPPSGAGIDTYSNGPVAGGSYYHFNWSAGATGGAVSYADDMYTHIYNAERTISSITLNASGMLSYNYGTENATVYARFFDVDGTGACEGTLIAQSAEGTWPANGPGALDLSAGGLSYLMQAGHRIRVELWVRFASDSWPFVRVTYNTAGGNKLIVTQSGSSSTTVGSGTDPADSVIGPGGPPAEIDAFTVQTSQGTDIIETVTVTIRATGSTVDPIPIYNYLSTVSISSDDGTITYGSATNTSPYYADWDAVIPIVLTTPIVATTTPSQYKIGVRAKAHAAMPTDYGTAHETMGRVTEIGPSTNPKGYGDLSGTHVLVRNSPGLPSFGTVTANENQVSFNWTYPSDAVSVLLLRRSGAAVTDAPADMVTYSQGNVIGSSTVAYSGGLTSFVDSGLSSGTYYYRLFAVDEYGNYSTPGVDGGPYTTGPLVTVGNGTNPSDKTILPGGPATELDSFTLQTSGAAASVTGITFTLSAGGWPEFVLSRIEVTSDDGATIYANIDNPAATAINLTLSPAIPVDATGRQYKVRVTPKTSAQLPLDSYLVIGTVTAVTTSGITNKAYQDSSSAKLTIDKNYQEPVYNMSADTISSLNDPLYSVPLNSAFSVRGKFIDRVTGAPVTGLTSSQVVIYRIRNMTTNTLLSSGTHYTSSSVTDRGGGVYDRSLYLYSGAAAAGDILQIELRGQTGQFVEAQWIAATQYVKVAAAGAAGNARYVEIQPSTAGDITALNNGTSSYAFKVKFIDAAQTAYNPGSLSWSVGSIRDSNGTVPAGTYTVSAVWNNGGWYDCTLNMVDATLASGNGYYIVINAALGNYVFAQSLALTARASQTMPPFSVPAFTEPAIDITPPVEGTLTVVNDSGNGYVPSAVSFSETFTDNESTVTSCEYTLDGGVWSAFTSLGGAIPSYTCSTINTGTRPDGISVTIQMRASSSGGTSTPVTTLNRIVDAVPPTDGLLTVTPGYKSNTLGWTDATDARSGLDATNTYVVIANVGGGIPLDCTTGTGMQIYSGSATTFTHSGLLSGRSYGYRVCAYDKVRNRSAGATGAGTTLTDTSPPAEIGGTLTLSPDTGTHTAGRFAVSEDFADLQTPVTSCRYTINGSNWYAANVTSLGGGNYRCTAPGASGTNGLSLTAMMKATSDGGESVPSALLARTVDAQGPADGTLTVTPASDVNRIDLSWTFASDAGSGLDPTAPYKIVYQTGATPPADCNSGTQIYSGPETAFSHANLENLTIYSYRVCAYDRVGNASVGATGSAPTGRKATAAGTVSAIPFSSGFSSGINVIVPYRDDANENNTYSIDFRLSSDTIWLQWGEGSHSPSPFTATVSLVPAQTYDIRVTYHDPDGVTGEATQILTGIRIASDKLVHNSMNANKKNYWPEFGGWGLPGTQYGEFTCATCHEPRASNIAGIKSYIELWPLPGPAMHFGGFVIFQSKTGPDSFGDDSILRDPPPAASRICEVCHTQTYGMTGPPPAPTGQIHRFNQTDAGNHANANGTDCTFCHTHNTGFKAPW